MRMGGGSLARDQIGGAVEAVPLDEEGTVGEPIRFSAAEFGWETLVDRYGSIYSFKGYLVPYGREYRLVIPGPSPLFLGQVYAVRFKLLQFIGAAQLITERMRQGQAISEIVLNEWFGHDYPWGRRFRAGVWPWEEGWAVGEANLVWKAIGDLESRVERLEQSLTRLEALLSRWERLQSALSTLFGGEEEYGEED